MNPALLIRLRPVTPWRIGPDSGSPDQAEAVFHSDAFYSAVCAGMGQLGTLEEWLNATAREYGEPAVRFSSCFPFQRSVLFVPPPASVWPPQPNPAQPARIRWKGAKLVPAGAVAALLEGQELSDEDYALDGHTGCLLPTAARVATGPYRLLRRSSVAVDRLTGGLAEPHATASIQFAPGSGLWCVAQFANPMAYAIWAPKVQAALRLLSDSGFGGLRSRGFGRARVPEFHPGVLPDLILPGLPPAPESRAYWMLSLFSPASTDSIAWDSGHYSLIVRSGRTEGASGGSLKQSCRMVAEGSVLVSPDPPRGAVRDVAPAATGHPVYRAGYAVALAIPWRGTI